MPGNQPQFPEIQILPFELPPDSNEWVDIKLNMSWVEVESVCQNQSHSIPIQFPGEENPENVLLVLRDCYYSQMDFNLVQILIGVTLKFWESVKMQFG